MLLHFSFGMVLASGRRHVRSPESYYDSIPPPRCSHLRGHARQRTVHLLLLWGADRSCAPYKLGFGLLIRFHVDAIFRAVPMARYGSWLIPSVLVLQIGCSSFVPPVPLPPPTEEIRARLGRVGIASAIGLTPVSIEPVTRGKGAGAAKGAGLGALAVLGGAATAGAGGAGIGAVVGLAVGIALAPIGAVVGTIHGAVTAPSAEKVEEAEAALKAAVAALKIQDLMRRRVVQVARDRITAIVMSFGEDADQQARRSVDSVLEVAIPSVSQVVQPLSDIDPPVSVMVQARWRFIAVSNAAVVYPVGAEGARATVYVSAPRRFVDWGAADARLFREEMARAFQALAETIIDDAFLVYVPPGPRWTIRDDDAP